MTFGDWLDERIGHRARLARLLDHPIAGGASWAAAMGGAITIVFALLALTGVLLMTAYAATPQSAWASVRFINHALSGGWLVRGVHHYASHAMVVLVGIHLAHVIAVGAYKKPREVWFWLGLALAGLVVATAITGHALPWDQKGYWARRVEAGILGMAPGVGGWLAQMIQGGPEYGALGLARMHALHVAVLPASIAAVLMLRASAARALDRDAKGDPYAKQLARNIVVALVVLAGAVLLARHEFGAPLAAPADASSDYPARPEWFLMALFRLRKFFHGTGEFWGTVGLPFVLLAYVAALPWLDRKPNVALGVRAPALAPVVLAALGGAVLHVMAVRHDAGDAEFQKANAKANAQAILASEAASAGVPPTGPLDMPELRGRKIFEKSCASCHVLGDLGDPKKANAPKLDGWGTEAWLIAMLHDPDATDFFGRTPYKGEMPSADAPAAPKKPMTTRAEMEAVATFLAAQGDEPNDPPRDKAKLDVGGAIVRERCTTCHLFEGKGDDEGSGKAPELSHYGSLAWTRAQIANPTSVTTYRDKAIDAPDDKGHMPRFDEDLSASDVDLVARWLRAQGRTRTKR
jgi:ubiquinol-cytochrome c reductase cytochrome b subunit